MATPEEKQMQQEEISKLQGNLVFQEMLAQLKTRLRTRRKEQRLAMQKCDKDTGLLLEGIQIGIEEALRIYEAQQDVGKPEGPTSPIKY